MTRKQRLFDYINSRQDTQPDDLALYICLYNKDMKAPELQGFFRSDFNDKMAYIDSTYDDDLVMNRNKKIRIYGYFDTESKEWVYLNEEGELENVKYKA